MLWTLLIWVVVGLVVMSLVWPMMVLVRAHREGYDLKTYMDCMVAVLEEDDIEQQAKHNKFVLAVRMVFHNVFWPYKLIWLTRKFVPKFDERHIDLMIDKIQKGEQA